MARITLTNEIYSAYLICMCTYMIGDRINYVICASQSDSMPAACCPLYAAPLLTGDLHDMMLTRPENSYSGTPRYILQPIRQTTGYRAALPTQCAHYAA
jgi:hypothetical protein